MIAGLLAGLLGGAAAGAGDALATVARGVGGLTGGRVASLVALDAGLGAAAGVAVAGAFIGVRALLSRVDARRGGPLAAALLAAPLVAYDAFSLFTGPKAARVPGRHAISAALLVLGLVAVAAAARGAAGLLGRARRSPRLGPAVGAALVIVAALAYETNRRVLPRLYPWFHLTLSVALLVAAVLAARFLAAGRAPGRRPLVIAGVAAAAVLAAGVVGLRGSQMVRFAAHDRTQVASVVLKAVPLARAPRRAAVSKAPIAADGTPLPKGPGPYDADVVLITVDALRADHIGAYGYHRELTPNIDALARRGVRFERAYSQAPHTSFAVASMLTGKYYPTIARLAAGEVEDPIPTLLRKYGWKTAAFYPPAIFTVEGNKLKAYQDTKFNFEWVKEEYLDAPERVRQIDEFLRTDQPRRAFMWLHLFEPHEKYVKWPGFDHGDGEVDRYDSEIAYTDAAIGKILAYLEERRPGAIVILTADHGEEFGEHGGRYHGRTLFEEQIRVPLIIAVPGLAPKVVGGQVEVIDVAPTVLGLLDIPVPPRMRGTDLGPWLVTPGAPADRLPPAFAEVGDKRMISWNLEKLICDLQFGYCEYYDLREDPGERKNRADDRPDRVAALRARLDAWLDDHARFEPRLKRGMANPDGEDIPRAIERGRLKDLMVMNDLAALLQSREPLPVRREAARLLVTLPRRPETEAAIRAALDVADPELRDWVAIAATRYGDQRGQARSREIVARGGPPPRVGDIRVHAAMALADVKDPAGVPVLGAALDDCADTVNECQLILYKLAALKDRRAVPALLKHLPDVLNRREVVMALAEIGDAATVGALIARLKEDEYVPVRAEAARALGAIGGDAAREALEWADRHERDPMVREAIEKATGVLRGRGSSPGPSPGTERSRP